MTSASVPRAIPHPRYGCTTRRPSRRSAEEHAALEELQQEASQRGWWSTARLPEWLASYVGLEADATTLRCLVLELIPGLLQTEAYAREVHLLGDHMKAPDEVVRWVAARVRRV